MSEAPEIPPALMDYFAVRRAEREQEIVDTLAGMNPRERRLFREAAVMGFVQGVRAGEGNAYGKTEIPKDSDTVRMVVEGCLTFRDLYPWTARRNVAGWRKRRASQDPS